MGKISFFIDNAFETFSPSADSRSFRSSPFPPGQKLSSYGSGNDWFNYNARIRTTGRAITPPNEVSLSVFLIPDLRARFSRIVPSRGSYRLLPPGLPSSLGNSGSDFPTSIERLRENDGRVRMAHEAERAKGEFFSSKHLPFSCSGRPIVRK